MYLDRHNDVICAPATIPGTGAISVIRVSGESCFEVVDAVVSFKKGNSASAPGYTIKFGNVENLDEVLVSVFRAPHSYTGENSVEISCHASSYIVSAMLERLYSAGARAAAPGEFTQRAFLNGKMDLAQAEAVADVIASSNAAAHRVALSQLKGGFSSELKFMRDELLHIVSLMELELDFSEEEVEFADRGELVSLLERVVRHVSSLVDSFRLGNAIKNGVPVAIVGATNTGKSTLLNALLGEERAIVSDVHGTTRDTIEETYNIGGVLFRFIDTAGLRTTDETVEQIGIERTLRKLHEASVVLVMLDVTRSLDELSATLDNILPRIDFSSQKVAVLLNKIDLLAYNKNVNYINDIVLLLENKCNAVSILKISARSGEGIEELGLWLANGQKDSISSSSDTTLVTNQRHLQALSDARTALCRVLDALGVKHVDFSSRAIEDTTSDGACHCNSVDLHSNSVLEDISRDIQDEASFVDSISPAVPSHVVSTDPSRHDCLKETVTISDECPCVDTGSVSPAVPANGVSTDSSRHEHVDLKNSTYGDTVQSVVAAQQSIIPPTATSSRITDTVPPVPTEFLSQDIREAIYHLGSIIGEISTDEVLGNIFRNFCIGK